MTETGRFKCLRCEYEYEDKYIPRVPMERSCPKCGSNSVRNITKVIKKK